MTAPLTPLIGLGGLKRAGKDAVADILVAEYGFVKIGMSDPLHEAMLALDPIIPINEYADAGGFGAVGRFVRYSELVAQVGYVNAKTNTEARRLLQKLGTEVSRNLVGENVWVDIATRSILHHLDAGTPVVVTGIRFDNELFAIEDIGGDTVWIERPEVTEAAARSESTTAAHASEVTLRRSAFSYAIINDSTLEDLRESVGLFLSTRGYLR